MASVVEICSISNARKDIEDLSFLRRGVTGAVGGKDGEPKRCCKIDGRLIASFLFS